MAVVEERSLRRALHVVGQVLRQGGVLRLEVVEQVLCWRAGNVIVHCVGVSRVHVWHG